MTTNSTSSPPWSSTTKLVVALTLVAILAGFIVTFRGMLGPLLLSFVLAYLVYPLAHWVKRITGTSWRVAVSILYLVGVLTLIGLVALGGIALVDQVTAVISFVQNGIRNLPGLLERLLASPIQIGPFEIPTDQLDVTAIVNQLLGIIQPAFSQLGTWIGSFAAGAATTVGWVFFIVLVSYFVLAESAGLAGNLIKIDLPGYREDLKKFQEQLERIWNAFLRGQLLLIAITIMIYTIILAILGVKYFYGLAVVAGLARFVPYLGAWIAWITYGLVSYFQGGNPFGFSPLGYVALVLVVSWVTDAIIDNLIGTRLLAYALKIHPAAVMVGALVALNLLGLIGVVLAAPVLATANLFLNYALRKLTDQDPWENLRTIQHPPPLREQIAEAFNRLQKKLRWVKREKEGWKR